MAFCTAKAKSTGERCRKGAVTGFTVCRLHGANKGTPGNKHAVKHGAFATLIRDRLAEEDRETYDAIETTAEMATELRILRFKLLKIVGDVDQNVHGAHGTWQIKADEFEKGRAIAYLAGEIRKLVKDMREVGEKDPLVEEIVRDWEEGMIADGTLAYVEPQPEGSLS